MGYAFSDSVVGYCCAAFPAGDRCDLLRLKLKRPPAWEASIYLVPGTGIEPASRFRAADFKSAVFTNFTTPARDGILA
jgi:hypothetical protein